jgi:exportin-T
METIMQHPLDSNRTLPLVAEISNLISAIGCITKGFPEYVKETSLQTNSRVWFQPFLSTLQGITVVLSQLNQYKSIRESARFLLQRMTGCMGPELLEYLPTMLGSGLLSGESPREIVDFLPFFGLCIYKFKGLSIRSILCTVWKPLFSKIMGFLSQPSEGTDDLRNAMELRKAYLTLVATIFNSRMDDIFFDPGIS